jgi:hypothetical protein
MPKRNERSAAPPALLVLFLEPSGAAAFKVLPHTLEAIQKELGGYMEEVGLNASLSGRHLVALVNEDGVRLQLPPNPFAWLLRWEPTIVGNVLVLRSTDSGEFASLTPDDVELLRALLADGHVEATS